MTRSETPATRGAAAQAISNAVVQLMRDYTGRGPTQAHTTITDSHVIVVLRDALMKGELCLVEDGHAEAVIDMRRRFQSTMRTDLVAAVVEHTGRQVLAFLSDHHIDPDIAVELFILTPRPRADDRAALVAAGADDGHAIGAGADNGGSIAAGRVGAAEDAGG